MFTQYILLNGVRLQEYKDGALFWLDGRFYVANYEGTFSHCLSYNNVRIPCPKI